ncbi:AtuA-related protein [Hydrogenophaga sp.]|uniref:AtuA-related protein n=1 Tax=Hydrogenophaga sp. TaxID=1904254 RepID=UPI003F70D006
MSNTIQVPLWRAAHGRTGDKGNRSNISVIAWSEALWPHIEAQITAERVSSHFRHRAPRQVVCHQLPNLHALNFVLDDVLDGGVNDALNLDSHGKALSFHLLELELEIPDNLVSHLRGPSG